MGKYAHEEPCAVSAKTATDRKYKGITVLDPLRLDAETPRTPALVTFRTPVGWEGRPVQKTSCIVHRHNCPSVAFSTALISFRYPPAMPPQAIRLPNLTMPLYSPRPVECILRDPPPPHLKLLPALQMPDQRSSNPPAFAHGTPAPREAGIAPMSELPVGHPLATVRPPILAQDLPRRQDMAPRPIRPRLERAREVRRARSASEGGDTADARRRPERRFRCRTRRSRSLARSGWGQSRAGMQSVKGVGARGAVLVVTDESGGRGAFPAGEGAEHGGGLE